MPRSLDGLQKHSTKRRTETRAKIRKALREMKHKGLTINPNALARYAHVSRKTIYNHTDLLAEVKAASDAPTPRLSAAGPEEQAAPSSIAAALREQLRTQKRSYETTISALKAEIKQLKHDLAAAHGEIHRLSAGGDPGTAHHR
ncbi:DUF6262 family protein [Mycolicibacterium brisbanense]